MTTNPDVIPSRCSHACQSPKSRRGITLIELLVVIGIIVILVAILLPATQSAPGGGRRDTCLNNLRQIDLSLNGYATTHNGLPPAYTVDAEGKPLHSWRALILPYLERNDIYRKIDFSKPWSDPANEEVYQAAAPYVFRCPSADCPENFTTYLAIVTPNGCLRPEKARPLSEITDNHANTLMVIEVPAEHAVHWMEPTDADEQLVMAFGPNTKLPHPGGVNAAFVDGSVRFLKADLPAAERRAMISIAGNAP